MSLHSKVKDMSLADFGRKELNLAEVEMPGLMAARAEFAPSQPLAGVNISGYLIHTEFIEFAPSQPFAGINIS